MGCDYNIIVTLEKLNTEMVILHCCYTAETEIGGEIVIIIYLT